MNNKIKLILFDTNFTNSHEFFRKYFLILLLLFNGFTAIVSAEPEGLIRNDLRLSTNSDTIDIQLEDTADSWYKIAEQNFSVNRIEQAIQAIQNAIKKNPDNFKYYDFYHRIFLRQGEIEKAESVLLNSLETTNNFEAYMTYTRFLKSVKKTEGALVQCKKMLQKFSKINKKFLN